MIIREAKQEVYFVFSRNEKSHSLHILCDSSFVGMTKEHFLQFLNNCTQRVI